MDNPRSASNVFFAGGSLVSTGHMTCPFGGSDDGTGQCIVGPPTCPSGTSLGDFPGATVHGMSCLGQPTCTTGTLQNNQCTSTTTSPATCPTDYQLQGAQCTKTTTS